MVQRDRGAPAFARRREGATPDPAAATGATYIAERLASTDDLLTLADGLGSEGSALPFQQRAWLGPWYAHMGRVGGAVPCPIAVRDAAGRIAVLLPLVIRSTGSRRSLEPADGGLSDYNAPILGPAAPTRAADARKLWAAVARLRLPADVARFDRLPTTIHGRPNPLALLPGVTPSPLFGSLIELGSDFEAFLRARGKHFRKEVNRSFRVLEREGAWTFLAPDDPMEARRLLDVLDAQQAQRMEGTDKTYILGEAPVVAHYRDALAQGLAAGTARIFALAVGDQIIAAVFGLIDRDRFLLLRIANAGEAWKHCSPGRLIVAEVIRWMMARGFTALDMTIGDYPFKRQFDPVAMPLVDLTLPLGWRGWLATATARAKAHARRSPLLVSLSRRMRGT